jgi:hypothetical protein
MATFKKTIGKIIKILPFFKAKDKKKVAGTNKSYNIFLKFFEKMKE